jgi:DNA-binding IclR family transcriptional regulator
MLISPLARQVARHITGRTTVEEIAFELDLPVDRVQIAVDELQRKTFLQVDNSGEVYYLPPVTPEEVERSRGGAV